VRLSPVTLIGRAAYRPDVQTPPIPGGVLRFGVGLGYGDMVRLLCNEGDDHRDAAACRSETNKEDENLVFVLFDQYLKEFSRRWADGGLSDIMPLFGKPRKHSVFNIRLLLWV
jgi:hypothetical protein